MVWGGDFQVKPLDIIIRVLAVIRAAWREMLTTLRWIGYILKEEFEETKKRWGK